MNRNKISQAGFTLVEVALVLVIGGIIMAAGATMLLDYLNESRRITTQNRMQDIDNALMEYLSLNGVLPCPANLNDLQDTATFGVEINSTSPTTTHCKTLTALPATANIAGPSGAVIVMGAVPVRTLNLPDQEMADAWGDRFLYAVTDPLTFPGTYDPTLGAIKVTDGATNVIADPTAVPPTGAQYVIVSYGPDHAGAWTIAGVQGGTTCPVGKTETPNCTFPTNTFVKTLLNSDQTNASQYDDYVTFRTTVSSNGSLPSGMIAPFAPPITSCSNIPGGWISYAGPASVCTTLPTGGICCQKL